MLRHRGAREHPLSLAALQGQQPSEVVLVTMDELAALLFVRWRPLHVGVLTSPGTAAEEETDLVCVFLNIHYFIYAQVRMKCTLLALEKLCKTYLAYLIFKRAYW